MIGPEGAQCLRDAFVVVIGLGAVGSYAVEAMVRAGVGHLRLIDFDCVKLSNINRQLFALESTLGRRKIDVARRRVADINPECLVETDDTFAHTGKFDALLAGSPQVVIDAIDSLAPKAALLAELVQRQIPMVSCMGAGLRRDPTKVRVGPLSKTIYCPLARMVRKRLRRAKIAPDKILCVYSIEPLTDLRPGALADYEDSEPVIGIGRQRRTVGALPTLTGIFGLIAANTALQILLQGTR